MVRLLWLLRRLMRCRYRYVLLGYVESYGIVLELFCNVCRYDYRFVGRCFRYGKRLRGDKYYKNRL